MREFSIAAIACVVASETCCRCDAIIQSRARLAASMRRAAKHESSHLALRALLIGRTAATTRSTGVE